MDALKVSVQPTPSVCAVNGMLYMEAKTTFRNVLGIFLTACIFFMAQYVVKSKSWGEKVGQAEKIMDVRCQCLSLKVGAVMCQGQESTH